MGSVLRSIGVLGRCRSRDRGNGGSCCRFLQGLQAALVGLPAWRRREVFPVDRAVILAHVPARLIHHSTADTFYRRFGLSGRFLLALEMKKQPTHYMNRPPTAAYLAVVETRVANSYHVAQKRTFWNRAYFFCLVMIKFVLVIVDQGRLSLVDDARPRCLQVPDSN